jgi:outer membrane cobalamin receptor
MAGMFVLSGPGVLAEEGAVLPNEVVVTATKTEKRPQDLTQSVTVITSDEIRNSGATTAAEVIRTAAGVMVTDQGPLGSLATVNLRGSTYQQVLVLLDGKRLNSPIAGGFDMSELPVPLEAIDRIEIVRGPSSALYGADAVGGVVNFITKKPAVPLTSLSGAIGAHGYTSASLYNSGREGNTYYTLSAAKERSHGYRANSDLDQINAGIKLGYDLDPATSIEASSDYLTKDIGVPGSLQFPSPLARQQARATVSGLLYKQRVTKALDFSARAYQNQERLGFQDPIFSTNSRHRFVSSGVETQVNWLMNSFNLLTMGAEGREDRVTSTDAGTHTASLTSEYIQDEMSLGDSAILVLSGRNDSHSVYGNKWSRRVSGRYLAAESGTILRASAGESFRAPTFIDLYFTDAFGNTGNPDLRPETAEEYEGGIEQPFGSGSMIKGTVFKRRVKDLIVMQTDPVTFPVSPGNIGRARITGVEAETKLALSRKFSWLVTYTHLFPVNEDTGERIFSDVSRIPDMQIGSTLTAALDEKTVISLQYRRVKNYVRPGDEKWDYYTVDGKITDTVVARKDLKADIFIGMKNLFNRKYETVKNYPMPPAELYGGITAQF